MQEYMAETDLHGMEWSAQSPDLNIIGNVWHKIKHEHEIPIYYIQDLYKSIPKRLRQVIKTKECITKY